ncbi:uncharacterized protein EDB93DRAFT_561370 [Suillus bovinus]|uniref:uncharacterized protein n=1 Tax=Suillus bovinus TaxID=48563 RepID=UPI001B87BE76|nr:uncharacterized protein EDB93DRAFT_561370 [Suillus bovinus]KAG2158685.1 hypothetical protein EDB93DRAFT_561370 [Suillus bovinus]
MLEKAKSQSTTIDHQTSSPVHGTRPSIGPWTSGDSSSSTDHNRHNFTRDQYSTLSVSASFSQALAIPPPQNDHSTTINMLPFVPNYGFNNNIPTLHRIQYHNPTLGASIVHSFSPAIGSSYPSPLPPQKVYPNGRSSRPIISSQYTVINDTPFVFDPHTSTSDFSLYNNNSRHHQWQTHAVSQPGISSLPFTPAIPPPQAAESSQQLAFVMPPYAIHGEQPSYRSNQPPINQPPPPSLHSHPSTPVLSCRWLNDAAIHCGFTGSLKELRLHCKIVHFSGPNIAQIECHWEGCDYHKRDDPTVHVMRRDSIWRHTCEVHLRLKRGSN